MNHSFALPPQDNQESEYHSSQMGKMRHCAAGLRESDKKLYHTIAYHHPLSLDRHRDKHDEQRAVRKYHAESKKHAEYCARGSYGDQGVEKRKILTHSHRMVNICTHGGKIHPVHIGKKLGEHIVPCKGPYKLLDKRGAHTA